MMYATVEAAVEAIARQVGGTPAGQWPYHDINGAEVFTVLRFDLPEKNDNGKPKKEFRPIHQAGLRWTIGDPKGPLPLYGLPDPYREETVWVVEGEKAAAAARSIRLVATTSAHGANSPQNTDWSALAGVEAHILPDNDAEGEKYARHVAGILATLDPPATVKLVELPELPDKGDIGDFIEMRKTQGLDGPAIRAEIEQLADVAKPFVSSVSARQGESVEFGEPQPLPDELSPVLSFDPNLLPCTLRPWVMDIAHRIQCPPDFPAVAAMILLAILVGRALGIRPKRKDDWLVVPNLWGAVIGRPGIMKTPALQAPFRLLHRLEIKAKQQYEKEMKEYEAGLLVAKERRKIAATDIRTALNQDGDAIEIAKSTLDGDTEAPVRKRYLTSDTTVEKLGELLRDNPRGVGIYRDELLGFLKSLEREGHEGARAFYQESWNGDGRFTYDRIGRGTIDIEAAITSIIGGVQPGPLGDYQQAAVNSGAGDDGFLQRFQLSVWPDVSRGWANVDEYPDKAALEAAEEVGERLANLDPDEIGAERDENDPDGIPFLRLSEGAQQLFDDWRADLERRIRSGDLHPALESHLSKYRSLVPSLALLYFTAEGLRAPVGSVAMEIAIRWAEYLESHARRIYATAVNPEMAAAKALAKKILRGEVKDGFALRDVYRRGWTGLSRREDTEQAAECLVDLDWLVEVRERTTGRTRTRYRINPRVFKLTPDGTDKTDRRGGRGASVGSVGTQGGPDGDLDAPEEDAKGDGAEDFECRA